MISHTFIVLINYICLFVMFFCLIVVCTQKSSHMQKLALLVSICLTMSSLGFLFKAEARDLSTYITGQKVAYLFTAHGMFLMVLFVMEYCDYTMPSVVKWVCCGLNTIVSISALTMDYHTLFYKNCYAIPMDGYVIVEKEYGILHTLAVALFIIYMLVGLATAIVFCIKNMQARRKYALRMLFAYMIPCLFYIVPKLTGRSNDFQSVGYVIFSLMMLYLTYQNNLYDVDNIAAQLSIASMEEAFIVIDNQNRFKGCNKIAEDLFPRLKNLVLDSAVPDADGYFKGLMDGKVNEFRKDGKIYSISVRRIETAGILEGYVLKFEDVTMQRQYTELLEANKAQIDKDLELAKKIQNSALPDAGMTFSAVQQIDVASFMEAARDVGGDFYDFYMLDRNRAVFLIADVSGKGMPAAMFMMRAKTTIRSYTEQGMPVNEVFTKANEQLCQGNDAGMFVTAWMGILEIDTGHMTFVNAGHNAPVIIRKDGNAEYLKSKVGFVLAGMEGINYRMQELELRKGDRMLLYTDGVTEATNSQNELYGEERLLSVMDERHMLKADDMLSAIKEDVDHFVGEAEQFDDITMVILDIANGEISSQ